MGTVGMLIVMALGVGLSVAVGWNARSTSDAKRWGAPGLGGMFNDIAGTLAGFSIASAIFIASSSLAPDSPSFAAVVGMLLISFLILMSTAMMYSSTPTFSASDDTSAAVFHSLTNVLANAGFFLGAALSWLALRPLLVLIGLPALADAFTWLLLVTAVAGSARLAGLTYRLTAATWQACLLLPILGFGLPASYWAISQRAMPSLWPEANPALAFTFLAFAVTAVALALQTGILMLHADSSWARRLESHGHRLALAIGQAAVMAIGLAWVAVATI